MKTRLSALAALLVALAATLALGSPSAADHDDVRGPSCGDIVDATGSFDGSTINYEVWTAGASCVGITYTLNVFDISCPMESGPCSDAEPVPVASQTVRGDRATAVEFSLDASSSDGDDRICVFVTSNAGGHSFDRAPDSGCTIREAVADPFGTPFDCLVVCDSCSDFVNGYSLPGDPLTFVAITATASCSDVTYTVEFFDRLDGFLVRSESVVGNSTNQIVFDLTPRPGEDTLTIRATSSYGGHVLDEGGICCALRFH